MAFGLWICERTFGTSILMLRSACELSTLVLCSQALSSALLSLALSLSLPLSHQYFMTDDSPSVSVCEKEKA